MEKDRIREEIKILKKSLSAHDKINAARMVYKKICQSSWFKDATNILTYHSLPDELNTHFQLLSWKDKKNIFLPRCNGDSLDILAANETAIGAYNIYEPTGDITIPPTIIQLAIIPGIAFDTNGMRLGRGKGYYDRFLHNTTALKIGIGYDFQIVNYIPAEPHDIPMDAVITPNNTIILNKDKKWL